VEKIAVEPLELLTERLRLRTPQIEDADAIQLIVADPRVALTTASIPHPYPDDGAKGFILHVQNVASRDRRNLAIVLRDRNKLIGMVGYQTTDLEAEPGLHGVSSLLATRICKRSLQGDHRPHLQRHGSQSGHCSGDD
jgi:RimJ/RimL family protein N-acetyltransferase